MPGAMGLKAYNEIKNQSDITITGAAAAVDVFQTATFLAFDNNVQARIRGFQWTCSADCRYGGSNTDATHGIPIPANTIVDMEKARGTLFVYSAAGGTLSSFYGLD